MSFSEQEFLEIKEKFVLTTKCYMTKYEPNIVIVSIS